MKLPLLRVKGMKPAVEQMKTTTSKSKYIFTQTVAGGVGSTKQYPNFYEDNPNSWSNFFSSTQTCFVKFLPKFATLDTNYRIMI